MGNNQPGKVQNACRKTVLKPLDLCESQTIALEILCALDEFCRANDISYFLVGGALIGAIRSQDLLPWDDDIDVVMKRMDYERFCKEYCDSGNYLLLSHLRNSKYRYGMSKLIDRRTAFVEPTAKSSELGVFVDIFPLDCVANPEDMRRIRWRVQVYNYAYLYGPLATKGHNIKQLIRIALSMTYGRGSHVKALERIEHEMSSGSGGFLCNYWGAWGLKECVKKECFSSAVLVTIRGKSFPAPVGYHEWLTSVYGNYMEPPLDPPHYHGKAYLKLETAGDEVIA